MIFSTDPDGRIQIRLGLGFLAITLLTGTVALYGDEVTLDNGQKLIGRITKYDDPDLFLSVHFTDQSIPIRWKNIVAIKTDEPIRIELRDGRSFFANLRMSEDGTVTMQEPGAAAPVQTTRDDLFLLEERKGMLDGEFGISGTGSAGNLKSQSVRLYWDLYIRWVSQDLQFKGDATYDSSGGTTTGRSAYAQLRYDYRFGDPGFAFASVEQDHDYFGDILSRTVGTIGAGTYLANTSRLVLKTDLGISYTFSRLKIGEDSSTLGYRPSIYLQWKLPLDIRVKDTVTFYGNISKSSDWQARNELMFSREVFKGFQVNGGLTTTWDHGAADGVHARNDTYYFGIGYEF